MWSLVGPALLFALVERQLETVVNFMLEAAFMLAVLIGGSVRMVLETAGSPENLARLREELPRACRAYIAAAQ